MAPISSTNAQVIAGGSNWATSITGTTPSWVAVESWNPARGRFFTDAEVKSGAKVAVLGATVQSNLFPSGGAIGSSVIIKSVPFTVIGVLEAKGQSGFGRDQDDQVIVPISAMQLRLNGQNWLGSIFVSAQSPDAVASVVTSTEALLRLRHALTPRAPDDFSVRNIAVVQQAASATQTCSQSCSTHRRGSLIVGASHHEHHARVGHQRTRESASELRSVASERDILAISSKRYRCRAPVASSVFVVSGGLGTSAGAVGPSASPPSIALVYFAALVGVAFGYRRSAPHSSIDRGASHE